MKGRSSSTYCTNCHSLTKIFAILGAKGGPEPRVRANTARILAKIPKIGEKRHFFSFAKVSRQVDNGCKVRQGQHQDSRLVRTH